MAMMIHTAGAALALILLAPVAHAAPEPGAVDHAVRAAADTTGAPALAPSPGATPATATSAAAIAARLPQGTGCRMSLTGRLLAYAGRMSRISPGPLLVL